MKKLAFFLLNLIFLVSCKTHEARRPVTVKSGSSTSESINRNKKLVAKEEAAIQKIIDKDTANSYQTSEVGFWYYYEIKDTISSVTPEFGDVVEFTYNVKDLQGNTIYRESELDTITYAIDKEELFLGLREGIKLMKEGEVVTFLFPSYQAYGYYGDDNKIGTNIPLVSKVKLNKIFKQSTKEN